MRSVTRILFSAALYVGAIAPSAAVEPMGFAVTTTGAAIPVTYYRHYHAPYRQPYLGHFLQFPPRAQLPYHHYYRHHHRPHPRHRRYFGLHGRDAWQRYDRRGYGHHRRHDHRRR